MDEQMSELGPLLERYARDREALDRSYAIPLSPLRRERMKRFVQEWEERLQGWAFGELSHAGQIDTLLFRNLLRHELEKIRQQEERVQQVAELLPFADLIVSLEEARRKMEWVTAEEAAAAMAELVVRIRSAHEHVESLLQDQEESDPAPVRQPLAYRAVAMAGELRAALRRWFQFYDGYDPLFTWWVGAPYGEVDEALERYVALLREGVLGLEEGQEQDGPIVGDPIGREALLNELAYAMIPYTPEELIAIAEKEFAWCASEMVKAARELGYGEDWPQALEYVKTCHVPPGRQPALIKELALEALEFLETHDLVTVPPLAREIWRMEMMPPERQKVNPFFLGGEVIRVSFPTHTMPHDQKRMSLRGNNIHFARATVHHELIPGHHLQGFMMARHRPYRRIFKTPFWVEGWALYWEMRLWDLGFPQSPEDRVGFLFWRSHRCARIIFSLRFHLELMTPDECIDFLVERVGHERDNATAEVRRSFAGDYDPLYQCAYMIGGLQFRALHQELVGAGRMTDREFHDAVLEENSMPVEMLRALLSREPLVENFTSRWRFAGEISTLEEA